MSELNNTFIQQQMSQGQLYLFDCIDSTNEYLLTHCKTVPQGSVCIAKTQTAGRGRRGRQWIAPQGNLNYSLVWHYPIKQNLLLSPLSLIIGLMVIETLQQQGVKDLSIKWPNDIYHKGKKIAGVLVELKTSLPNIYLVMGIGINLAKIMDKQDKINQPVSDLSEYVIDYNQLVICLTKKLHQVLIDYPQTGFKSYTQIWQHYDLFFQKEVSVITETQTYCGISQGINHKGELLLKLPNNEILMFSIGDVSLRQK
ncbi:biotin--[acetyl-CoA-carboxylase] ligase [Pasteurella skyensis]|uniref:biotin--[biotin carboxyl-carrier protein] ligase n=1 Tax=Phocoenobacter skyensis TaxID=97481 RepID=A0AAJ6N801_9PAST|nr:biotin--[acetyl-CoA-carboxylase] ligase [Pasteurella skyensis]MDP8161737.1 biotin--[acetyl-CoA-carboxylase] ligase [Pasteurella skyensis]MDP8171893.1 biotin--[acetyl-CoA-carboxylase] ligase [Pasteurella skyensis]MDP8178148.1 biotin--[acetyl-CoA-carboxylase] ligase [Pasteurella skyensis]MDP8182244.1 biotin--[acetyl-CoA-carboxylase] ligase [Pasteurella skyensis]MDP8188455.1 biotin--[acetyl-CoA-carboxylase] ligase [Pasteurella skyensis]